MTGKYTENISINSKIYLIGQGTGIHNTVNGTEIDGTININITTAESMHNNTVNISGFLIIGNIVYNSVESATLNLNNVYIYSNDDYSGNCLDFSPTSADSRLRLDNCIFVSGGVSGQTPLVKITSKSLLTMNNCDFTCKGVQNCLLFSASATCDIVNFCRFACSSSLGNVKALVELQGTASSTFTFSNCGFLYSSSTNKSANTEASGILSNSSVSNNTIVCINSTFFLLGTDKTQNHCIEDLFKNTSSQMICLHYGNSASLNNANGINATNNSNKFQLSPVS